MQSGPLAELAALEAEIASYIAIIVGVFVVLASGQLFLQLTKDYAAGLRWKLRGYRMLETVTLDGKAARILHIGPFATRFALITGDKDDHYITHSNSRLDNLNICRVVKRYGNNGE